MQYFSSPIRAAEESRQGKAMSRYRYPLQINGKKVLAQIIYHKGEYLVTYAGLPNTAIRFEKPSSGMLDNIREWRPM